MIRVRNMFLRRGDVIIASINGVTLYEAKKMSILFALTEFSAYK